jgi:hypothetical protein
MGHELTEPPSALQVRSGRVRAAKPSMKWPGALAASHDRPGRARSGDRSKGHVHRRRASDIQEKRARKLCRAIVPR